MFGDAFMRCKGKNLKQGVGDDFFEKNLALPGSAHAQSVGGSVNLLTSTDSPSTILVQRFGKMFDPR